MVKIVHHITNKVYSLIRRRKLQLRIVPVHHVLNHLWREPKWCCSIAYLLKHLLWNISQINITFCILVELFAITSGFGTQRVFC